MSLKWDTEVIELCKKEAKRRGISVSALLLMFTEKGLGLDVGHYAKRIYRKRDKK